jgi:hypothetical protein
MFAWADRGKAQEARSMWAGWGIAAIALAAAAFMLRFLIALLREGAPSVCYWVVPVRREPEKDVHLKALGGIYFDDECCATDRDDYHLEFLENEGHAKEKYNSGFIGLDVHPASARLGWHSIYPSRGHIFREHRL